MRAAYETYFELRCIGDEEAEQYLDSAMTAERIVFRRLPVLQMQEDSERLLRRTREDHLHACHRKPCGLTATE